ncbi:MAG: SPOR domain-containing protein [Acidobacteria bacterium]|nr:SPOR domain-containing protein [Acidobacteriota bacterium]
MSTDARGAREHVADDGFHEIQLSGKQLVFLFMATTVVSVVIFLCGVLVGRGARPDPAALEAIGTPVSDAGAPVPALGDPAAVTPDGTPSADPGVEAPTTVTDADQSYIDALTSETQQATIETPAADAPPPPPPAEAATGAPALGTSGAETPTASTSAPATEAPAAAVPAPQATVARGGWTIQVSAFRDRGQADQFAETLKAKRYDAYVAAPDASSPLFRVRVGSFSERRDATRVADRLKKDKFKPWVTR